MQRLLNHHRQNYLLVAAFLMISLFSYSPIALSDSNRIETNAAPETIVTQPNSALNSDSQANDNNALTSVKVLVNWRHQFQFAGFYAAQAKGFYREKGLDVTIIDWQPGESQINQLLKHNADFAVAQNNILLQIAQGLPVRLVMANFQYSPLILLAHKPVQSLSELANKTVMHNGSLQIKTLLEKSFLKTGIYPKEILSSGNLRDFIDKKVDFYGAYNTNEPFQLERLGVPYSIVDPKVFGVQSYDGLVVTTNKIANQSPKMVQAFKEATIDGWKYAITHQAEIVDYILANFPTQKSREDMLNEAKATTEYIEPVPGSIGMIDLNKLEAVMSDARKFLNATIGPISKNTLNGYLFDQATVDFSPEERQFIQQNPVIKLANASDWPPIDFIKNGVYQGVAADFLKLVEAKTGLTFIPENLPWSEVIKNSKVQAPIVFPALAPSEKRKQDLFFTTPYQSFPLVLAGYNKDGFIDNFNRLDGYKVAVIEASWVQDFFEKNYPNVELHLVETTDAGLQSVMEHKALVYADNLAAINHVITSEGLTHFNIVGRADQSYHISMAVNKQQPVLFSIIQKSLNQINDDQRSEIYDKWFPIAVAPSFEDRYFWRIIMIISLVTTFLAIFLYIVLKRQNYLQEIYELSYATTIDFASHKITNTSKSFLALSGYSKKELIGMDYLALASPKISKAKIDNIMQLLAAGKSWNGELPAVTKNGEEYWVDLTLTPQRNIFGKVKAVIATRHDITDRKKIEEISITDELTGLLNRRKFNQTLPVEINRAKRENQNFAIIMLDIDFFKLINDHYGHDVGDEVLIEISTSLNSYFHRSNDFIFRIGGEEFVILTQFDSERSLEVHLTNLLIYVRSLGIENLLAPLKVTTISAGAILCKPSHNQNAHDLLKLADQLLYTSKQSGRNTLHIKVVE